MVDKKGILEHFRELNEALKDWERYQTISLRELRSDRDKQNMVLHALLVSIQASIDIANHIIAEKSLQKPSTYRETFEILSKEGIISSELGDSLSDLAGFRNVLVHIYWRVNFEQVHRVLQEDLSPLKEFKKVIKDLLQER
ncbi:DUF86 domain-containing protein [Candidatus Aerophobetes bacterium]|nr:DUF86 domain-containing protein [Candidatus Aerophobetes bacterium]